MRHGRVVDICVRAICGARHAISKDAVEDYVRSRLVSPRGAIIRADGELYPVSATINGKDWTGWAMDIRLNARHALSRRSGLSRHTVLVSQKEPVAMRRDTKKFRRLD